MGEQLLLIDQFLHIVERRTDVIVVEAIRQRVHDAVTIRFFVQRNNLVDEIVYEMNTSAVNIQHDVVAVQFILMYHLPIPSETDAPAFRHGAITLRSTAIFRTTLSRAPAHTADSRHRKMFCRQTGKMSGTRRNRHARPHRSVYVSVK